MKIDLCCVDCARITEGRRKDGKKYGNEKTLHFTLR